ncbi:voltage-dependent calcium channel subunit alpha-2/delta-2-like isoform X2 [Eriocheir sinensis]|uniref:voltage-dependent calcium channel subunit alpha-2/delta-2-like isoform X2 n=1 Tax=Eriocheir sinensis TaxID=95602 RepID=UPI0021C73C6E|nr:voltage-dependent calcium channel subunit alpha-2/delta-2-like isoform X2 [Eriocheir sinensis]
MAGGRASQNTLVIFLFLVTCRVSTVATGLDVKQFGDLANKTAEWLAALHAEHTHIELLDTDLNGDPNVSIKSVYLRTMAEDMANGIRDLFASKHSALQKIVELLEDATTIYIWNDNLNLNTSRPLLMKDLTDLDASNASHFDERLGVAVRHNVSGIHVPLEVYEGWLWPNIRELREQDPEILNGLQWSADVDRVFQENYEKDPTLMWQYFAAQTGFMRVYPATSWYVPPSLVDLDLYDARLRPWYVQGSVSPKDMIILMDRSGSVHGQTFTIMKWAVKTLIDTLGENDYVNVAAFNSTTEWVNNCTLCEVNKTSENKECTQPLIQATTSNKKLLFKAIDDLEDGGMASYSNALTFAYEAFNHFEATRKKGEGANCLKTIMLFSDGGTEWPEEVIKKYRTDNFTRSVRIFTYAVGPHPIPTAVLKQMAYCTGGMYSVITTRSSIRTKIQDYLQVLARPKAPPLAESMVTFYQERVTEELTVSLTRPVYNNSDYTNTSALLGVAGIDVPIKTLKSLSPFEAIGPNGYAFILNNNGFLILHPKLQKQLSYLSAPPHIDLLDLEEDTMSMESLRTLLIERKEETMQVLGKIRIDDHHHIVHNEIQFAYTPIKKTPYSLGLVNLKNSDHMVIRKPEMQQRMNLNPNHTIVAPWPYCNNHLPGTGIQQMLKLKESMKDKKKKCNIDLIQGLLWSQSWTEQLYMKWMNEKNNSSSKILSRAVFTRFGYTRYDPHRDEQGVKTWRDPWNNPALRRGEVTRGVSVIPHAEGAYLSMPVIVEKEKSQVMAGVVGVNFTASTLQHNFQEHIRDAEWLTEENYLLMLLDDGGLVVTANRMELNGINLQGRFIGELPIPILTNLKNLGIYKMDMVVDKQALCKQRKPIESAGGLRSCRIPSVFSVALNLLNEIFSWAEYLRYLIYSGVLALLAPSTDAWTEWGITQIGGLESCTMERAVYYFGEVTSLSSTMKCTNATEKIPFWAHRIPDTNALLVAIEMDQNSLECGVYSDLPSIVARRVTEFAPCAYQARYRKQPTSYVGCNATVGDSGCNRGPGQLEFSVVLLLFMLLLSTEGVSSIHLDG